MDRDVVAMIKGMVARGDRQMDVATYFGINQARVNELVKHTGNFGARYARVEPAAPDVLPEPGPYAVVSRITYERLKFAAAIPSDLLQRLVDDIAAVKAAVCNTEQRA